MNTKTLGLNNIVTFIKYVLFVSIFTSVLDVIWKVIENKFAVNEYANTSDYGNYGDSFFSTGAGVADAHIALTFIIVFSPLFLLASWYRNRIIEKGEDRNTQLFMIINWFFVAVSTFTLVSAFISSVYILIGGKQTLAGQLELLTVVIMFGLLLYRSIVNIRNKSTDILNNNKKMLLALPYAVIIIFAIVIGFMYANPRESISLQADKDRIYDMQNNMSEIEYYLKEKGTLPKDALEISKYKYYSFIKKDKDGKEYEYNFISSNVATSSKFDKSCYDRSIKDDYSPSEATNECTITVYEGTASYDICAIFDKNFINPKETESNPKDIYTDIYTWEHKAGKDCFKVDISSEDLNENDKYNY